MRNVSYNILQEIETHVFMLSSFIPKLMPMMLTH